MVISKMTMKINQIPYEFRMMRGNWGFEYENLANKKTKDFKPEENSRIAYAFAHKVRQAGRKNIDKALKKQFGRFDLYWAPAKIGSMEFTVVFARKRNGVIYDFIGYGIYWHDRWTKKKRCQIQYHSDLARRNKIYVGC